MRPSADADLLHRLANLGSELGFSTPLPGALIFSFWARYRQPRQARRSYQRIFATLTHAHNAVGGESVALSGI